MRNRDVNVLSTGITRLFRMGSRNVVFAALLFFSGWISIAQAQTVEICNDGIDNDGASSPCLEFTPTLLFVPSPYHCSTVVGQHAAAKW